MADLKVNHGGLGLASTDLTAAAQRLQQLIDGLETALNSHQHSWTGAAKDAYVPARAQWTSALTGMRALLLELGQVVDRSNQAYGAADLAGSRQFS